MGVLHPWFQSVGKSCADAIGVDYHSAPLKSDTRIREKVFRSYDGDAAHVTDIVRGSLVCETIEQVVACLELVLSDTTVHQIKNRFSLDCDGISTHGYRDVNVLLSFSEA